MGYIFDLVQMQSENITYTFGIHFGYKWEYSGYIVPTQFGYILDRLGIQWG